MKSSFLLDPAVAYLNHGSFGATPVPVFEKYQALQRELEFQPVAFISARLPALLTEARGVLGTYLGVTRDDVTFVVSPTFAVNQVARSLRLQAGDEVLTTDHEYGACERCWEFLSRQQGFNVVRQAIPVPLEDPESVADRVWAGVTPATKVLFISHLTSATAMRMPVEELCRRARKAGIMTLVDGAHAPSQLDLDIPSFAPDFYVGACHKWLCAPKGSSFLYARPEVQGLLEPLVVGWGFGPAPKPDYGSTFLNYTSWLGTRDMSAFLAVPEAIAFQHRHNWTAVRESCHELLVKAERAIAEQLGTAHAYGSRALPFVQMAVVELPADVNTVALKSRLLDEHQIEIPVTVWQNRSFLRVSIQAYNDEQDVERLLTALKTLVGGR